MTHHREKSIGVFVRGVAVWFFIIVVEIVHGTLRTILIEPITGDLHARRIGVFVGSILILVISFMSIRWIRARQTYELAGIGLLWVLLTVLFEVFLGLFVMGLSVERIISDYDISRGGLMLIGLLVMMASPFAAAYLGDRLISRRPSV